MEMTMETKTFPAGTMAKCNRCNQRCPLPKECKGHAENVRAFRLETMCTLDCGHMDAHWVLVSDVKEIES